MKIRKMQLVPLEEPTEMVRTQKQIKKALKEKEPRKKVRQFQEAFQRFLTYRKEKNPLLVKLLEEPSKAFQEEAPPRPPLPVLFKEEEEGEQEPFTPLGWRRYQTRLAEREETQAPRKKLWHYPPFQSDEEEDAV